MGRSAGPGRGGRFSGHCSGVARTASGPRVAYRDAMGGKVTPLDPPPPEPERSSEDDRLFSVEHRLRRAARSTMQPEPGAPYPTRRLVRDGAVLAAALVIGLLIGGYADAANPDYPEARAVQERIDSAWQAVVGSGVAPEEAAAAAGLVAYTFDVDGARRTVLTHRAPTSTGVCYALRFGTGVVTVVGILADPGDGCVPAPPGVFVRSGSWSVVLPSERITPTWFVPAVVVLFVAGLVAAVDVSIVVIARALGRPVP